ncbi:MAG: hypothetical protein EBT03_10350 [Betaproteobacteria bacterium]|nr:hypothetical protein [Betaproteobacteria bacterium]NCA17335.1 hypothetical protein [Betaproteobacteria bacterium]
MKNQPKTIDKNEATTVIPPNLCSGDLRAVADWLEDLAEGIIPSTISEEDAFAARDTATWLRACAISADKRDSADWRGTRASRDSSDLRSLHQRIAESHGVSEATVRSAAVQQKHGRRTL